MPTLREPCGFTDLIGVRSALKDALLKTMTERQRLFLNSLLKGEPAWEMLSNKVLSLPGVRWKRARHA